MRLLDLLENRLIHYPQERLRKFIGVVEFAGEYDTVSKVARPNMIDIHPNSERSGVGRALITDFEQWAREQGATHIVSGYGSWKAARGFWAKLGYRVSKSKNRNGAYDFQKTLTESTIDGPTKLTSQMMDQIRQWRQECRIMNGGYGMCHEVSEIIEGEWGWERRDGTYCHRDGTVVCAAHYWNIMPDGSIIDSTADQLGEDDIRIVKPSDPEFKQYRPEYYDDYHPGHPQFDADYPDHNLTWSGVSDNEELGADDRPAGWHVSDSPKKLRQYLQYWQDQLQYDTDDIGRTDDINRIIGEITSLLHAQS